MVKSSIPDLLLAHRFPSSIFGEQGKRTYTNIPEPNSIISAQQQQQVLPSDSSFSHFPSPYPLELVDHDLISSLIHP